MESTGGRQKNVHLECTPNGLTGKTWEDGNRIEWIKFQPVFAQWYICMMRITCRTNRMLPTETDFATDLVRDFPTGASKFNLIMDQLRVSRNSLNDGTLYLRLLTFQRHVFNSLLSTRKGERCSSLPFEKLTRHLKAFSWENFSVSNWNAQMCMCICRRGSLFKFTKACSVLALCGWWKIQKQVETSKRCRVVLKILPL